MKVSFEEKVKVCVRCDIREREKYYILLFFTVISTNYVLFIDKYVLFHSYKEM